MNIYIWERLEGITSNYHSAAGLVIVASTIDAAQVLYEANGNGSIELPMPDRVIPCKSEKEDPQVFIFPDAGCC